MFAKKSEKKSEQVIFVKEKEKGKKGDHTDLDSYSKFLHIRVSHPSMRSSKQTWSLNKRANSVRSAILTELLNVSSPMHK